MIHSSLATRAYERGYERYIVPGPGKVKKIRMVCFSVIKPKSIKGSCRVAINLFANLIMTADSDSYTTAVPKLFSARPNSEFAERLATRTSNNI